MYNNLSNKLKPIVFSCGMHSLLLSAAPSSSGPIALAPRWKSAPEIQHIIYLSQIVRQKYEPLIWPSVQPVLYIPLFVFIYNFLARIAPTRRKRIQHHIHPEPECFGSEQSYVIHLFSATAHCVAYTPQETTKHCPVS